MKLLLDTHALLWFALDDSQLSATARELIMSEEHEKMVSPASYWEIAIKISMKKYLLQQPYEDFLRQAIDDNGFIRLDIEPRHTALITTMPFHHRDPFDRLLVAQAMAESASIVSGDKAFDAYGVDRLW
jgi:PIN domain nuclease of toxin-antitoxin system